LTRSFTVCYVIFFILGIVVYLALPIDILPESQYGPVGILDDIFVAFVFAVCIGRVIYSGYVGIFTEHVDEGQNIEMSQP